MKTIAKILLLSALPLCSTVQADGMPISESPEGAKVYIISPSNGDTVGTTVTVKFGLQGMGVSPAGVDKANTGHHHLIVDGTSMPDADKPMGKEVMHFGGVKPKRSLN